MLIRRAENRDIDAVHRLLRQVLELHAELRPDLFVTGEAKYDKDALRHIFADDNRPVYVAVDEEDAIAGYAFCALQQRPDAAYIKPGRSLYVDDLCVDESRRGTGLGRMLFAHVAEEAARMGCTDVTLNVWQGNDAARAFYEKMGMSVRETKLEYKLEDEPQGKPEDGDGLS
ncbi:MAG: GNAT family N-acetyltransferase [Firmicutes bacterium]|nr:GNAT family N-acetyltransferase [Bacillota bacterium]MBQ6606420.1 GNAT family N-acetyltransferase [Bacillota bacterium]